MLNRGTNKRKKAPRNVLPYVQAAVFCEQVLEDKEHVLSAIRIFDRLYVPGPMPQMPAGMEFQSGVIVKVLVMLKSGSLKGKRKIKLVPTYPSGKNGPHAETQVPFEGGENGVNIQAQLTFQVEGEGIYWCDVLVNEELLTRMPLRISYMKPSEPSHVVKTT
jgi:hypothetical protein